MELPQEKTQLSNLLSSLQSYVQLEDADIADLEALHSELEREFGDLSKQTNSIKDAFLELYDKISPDSPLKQESRFFDKEYFENRDSEELERLLKEGSDYLHHWSTHFSEVVLPNLLGKLDGKIENGGIKSIGSIRERIASGLAGELNYVRDIIRGRFVGGSLREVENAIQILQTSLTDKIVSILNTYYSPFRDRRGKGEIKPYFASNFAFRIDDDLTYELQVMTKRASLIGRLDHPVRVKKQVELSPDLKSYLDSLVWGSHLLDFRDYFEIHAKPNPAIQ
jgi:hypothetical protein